MNAPNNEKQANVMQQPAAVWQDEALTNLPVSDEQAEQTKGGPGGNYFTGSVTVSDDGYGRN